MISGRSNQPLDQFHFQVPDTELPKLAGLVGNQLAALPNPWELSTMDQLDDYALRLASAFDTAVQIAGKPDWG
ncbi:hypothetical protein CDV55_100443 [Aspergillus turcosus]|nr:hypothetical protein CDV55_100443 [Aspergillus turcosus]